MSELQTKSSYSLPIAYNDNKIILLARDPHWLYAYWEISASAKENFKNEFGENLWERSVPFLKITNISKNTINYIRVNDFSTNWFINVEDANSLYVAEFGRKLADQFFIDLACSNCISTPNNTVSSNSATYFINYMDLRNGTLDFESEKIYETIEIQTNTTTKFGFSSPELFGINSNEAISGISSAELFIGNLKQHLGFSSLNLNK